MRSSISWNQHAQPQRDSPQALQSTPRFLALGFATQNQKALAVSYPTETAWKLTNDKGPRGQHELPLAEELPEYDPKVRVPFKSGCRRCCLLTDLIQCYLCPGNARVNGDRNPDYKSTFLFENDYHAVHMHFDGCKTQDTEITGRPFSRHPGCIGCRKSF